MALTHAAISTTHPRANGLIERYNTYSKGGLKYLLTTIEIKSRWDLISNVLAGIHLFPSYLSYSPLPLLYKKNLEWLELIVGTRVLSKSSGWWSAPWWVLALVAGCLEGLGIIKVEKWNLAAGPAYGQPLLAMLGLGSSGVVLGVSLGGPYHLLSAVLWQVGCWSPRSLHIHQIHPLPQCDGSD